ncbi:MULTISPECIES: hypothetical protein [unclassified Roseitalea]|uniref:hypothetical protein n=1 Tax=unclassified Roseitalea TaxID=2639107 RepID=UPI00273F4C06|nr:MULTISPECIES: hypothetical protein [unclassified Roseitalea]
MARSVLAAIAVASAATVANPAWAQDAEDSGTVQNETGLQNETMTEGTDGTASHAALLITAGAELDGALIAIADRTFDRPDEAIAHTEDALEHVEQLSSALQALAGDGTGVDETTYSEAVELVGEIYQLLETQKQALMDGDRDTYGTARIAIYQRVSALPDTVFTGPEGQPDNLR